MNKRQKKSALPHSFSVTVFLAALFLSMNLLSAVPAQAAEHPEIEGHAFLEQTETEYAEGFAIYDYEDGFTWIRVFDSADYLLVPEDESVPEELPEDVVILRRPMDSLYLAATSAMSLFCSIGAIDHIRLSSLRAEEWTLREAREAMEEGSILYAGKYREPDFELLIREGCSAAVESTMILHTPKVQEMIENLGIPVFIDRSSYETHPLGRTEWIRVYGAMTGREKEAEEYFSGQASLLEEMEDFENTGKTVAFFYLNAAGTPVVRNADDYIPEMIRLAGGKYIFDGYDFGEAKSSSVEMTMEEFYAGAMDADILIYNATIDDSADTLERLLQKSPLLADFTAVSEGQVYRTDDSLYQSPHRMGEMIRDLHRMIADEDTEEITFFHKM